MQNIGYKLKIEQLSYESYIQLLCTSENNASYPAFPMENLIQHLHHKCVELAALPHDIYCMVSDSCSALV